MIHVPNLSQTTDFWDLTRRDLATQRIGRYVPDEKNDPPELRAARTWPDVAGAVIDTYSHQGDLVLDLMAGTGVTLVEAIWRNRNAVGWELEQSRARRAAENLALSRAKGAPGMSIILQGDARHVDWDSFATEVLSLFKFGRGCRPALILIDPPYSEIRMDGGRNRFGGILGNYTGEDRIKGRAQRDQANIGNLKHAAYLVEMEKVYAKALWLAARGATLAVILKDFRKRNRRIPLVDDTRAICEAAGWRYHDRAVLYLGQASQQQHFNAKRDGNLIPVTQTLLVFRKG